MRKGKQLINLEILFTEGERAMIFFFGGVFVGIILAVLILGILILSIASTGREERNE